MIGATDGSGLAIALGGALLAAIVRAALGAYSRTWLFHYTPDAKAREQLERWLGREDRLEVTLTLLQVAAEAWFVLALLPKIPAALHGVELGPPGSARHLAVTLFVAVTVLVPLVHAFPNTLAGAGRAEAILKPALPVVHVLSLFLFPLVAPLVLVRGRAKSLLAQSQPAGQQQEYLKRDIVDAVAHGRDAGALKAQSAEMIAKILALEERVVSEVMTPRTELTSVAIDATLAQAAELAVVEGHSKIPVFEKNRDRIKGLFHLRDALPHLGAGVHPFTTVREVMRDALFVPETKKVAPLLRELQAARQSAALVLDEYGGTAGIITVEDILEEIVGELSEEHERELTAPFVRLSDRVLSLDPRLRIADWNDRARQTWPDSSSPLPEDSDYDTVGGFVLKQLDHLPEVGETLTHETLEFRVLRLEGRRIARLQVTRFASSLAVSV